MRGDPSSHSDDDFDAIPAVPGGSDAHDDADYDFDADGLVLMLMICLLLVTILQQCQM